MNKDERLGLEKLQEAFRLAAAEEWEHTERAPKEEIFYSEEYERKMEGLIRESKYPHLRFVNTVGKRVAVFALAVLLAFGCSMSISAVRKPVVNFFVKAHETFIELFFAPDDIERAPERIETVYTFSVLPPESAWLTQFVNEKDVTTTWANEKVNLTLVQTTLDARLFVNEDAERLQKRTIAGQETAVIEKFGVNIYIWNTEEYAFHLVIKGYLTEEELARIIDSLTVGAIVDSAEQTR